MGKNNKPVSRDKVAVLNEGERLTINIPHLGVIMSIDANEALGDGISTACSLSTIPMTEYSVYGLKISFRVK